MNPEAVTTIITVFIVIGLPVMGGTLIALAKILKGDSKSKKNSQGISSNEEAEIVQSIDRSLNRLEKRIDALETIILDAEESKQQSKS